MKKIMCLLAVLSLTACGGDNNSESKEVASAQRGSFKGTMGDRQYEVDIDCSRFETDDFVFRSDKSDVGDSNGDGLNINGFQMKAGKIILTINDHGKNYSSGVSLTKSEKGAVGAGDLWGEGDESTTTYPVTFEVICK